jgi:hypothetical protein
VRERGVQEAVWTEFKEAVLGGERRKGEVAGGQGSFSSPGSKATEAVSGPLLEETGMRSAGTPLIEQVIMHEVKGHPYLAPCRPSRMHYTRTRTMMTMRTNRT